VTTSQLIIRMTRLRTIARFALLVSRGSELVAITAILLLAAWLSDESVHLSAVSRVLLTITGFLALVAFFHARVGVLWRRQASLVDIALQLERRHERWRHHLASPVALGQQPVPQSKAGCAALMRAVAAGEALAEELKPIRHVRFGAAAWRLCSAVACMATLVLAAVTQPDEAKTALLRWTAPWADVSWPRRYQVDVLQERSVLPRDRAVPIRASLVRGPPDARVQARYRFLVVGEAGAWRTILLTPQPVTSGADGSALRLHEQHVSAPGGADVMEYVVRAGDHTTRRERVRLIERPGVDHAVVRVEPPSYAQNAVLPETWRVEHDRRREGNRSALRGSNITIDMTLNKQLPVPPRGGDAHARWREQLLRWSDQPAFVGIRTSGLIWTVSFRLEKPTTLAISPRDEFGFEPLEPMVFEFGTRTDELPVAAIVEPVTDLDVSPRAVVPVEAMFSDDIELRSMGIEATTEGIVTIARQELEDSEGELLGTVDVAALGVQPGDRVELTAWAADVQAAGAERSRADSPARFLRITDPDRITTSIESALRRVGESLALAHEAQIALAGELGERTATSDDEAEQGRIMDSAASTVESLERLDAERVMNRLEALRLEERFARATPLVAAAAEAARLAREELRQYRLTPTDEQLRSTREAQLVASSALGRAAASLQDQDALQLLSDELQQLKEGQRSVRDHVRQVPEEMLGRSVDELTEGQREQVVALSRRQARLADAATSMLERASEDEQGVALVGKARQWRLVDRLSAPVSSLASNQTQRAGEEQELALGILEQLQEVIDDLERDRDIGRAENVAAAIELIDALVQAQASINTSIGQLLVDDAPSRLRLAREQEEVKRDTESVRRSIGGDLDALVAANQLLDRASARQGRASTELRAAIGRDVQARVEGEAAVRLLRQASTVLAGALDQLLAEAAMALRDDLIEAYGMAIEDQVDVRLRSEEKVEQSERTRRRRRELRLLAEEQDSIRTMLADVEVRLRPLTDTPALRVAHMQIDRLAAKAAEALRDEEPTILLVLDQREIETILTEMISAFAPVDESPDKSSPGEGGGPSGGGESGPSGATVSITPIELRMIMGLQRSVMTATAELEALTRAGEIVPDERYEAVGQRQREVAEMLRQLIKESSEQGKEPGA
jgi:hypothetical protein